MFLHEYSALMAKMILEGTSTPPPQQANGSPKLHDQDAFPTLRASDQGLPAGGFDYHAATGSQNNAYQAQFVSDAILDSHFRRQTHSRSSSRPVSRQQSRPSTPLHTRKNSDAFPALGSTATKKNRRHSGRRENVGLDQTPGDSNGRRTMVEIVRAASSSLEQDQEGAVQGKNSASFRKNGKTAHHILPPENIPWLETGQAVNKAYLQARQEAFKHGGLRNKFLQG